MPLLFLVLRSPPCPQILLDLLGVGGGGWGAGVVGLGVGGVGSGEWGEQWHLGFIDGRNETGANERTGETSSIFSRIQSKTSLSPFPLSPSPSPLLARSETFETLEDFTYWSNLCHLQTDAGIYDKALEACEQALALEPEDSATWADRSEILLKLKNYPDAIASADQALLFDPENSLALTYKCMAYEALNDTEKALDQCTEALRVGGSWGRRSPALAWLHRGTILAQMTRYEQAVIAYDRVLLLEPEDSITLAHRCAALTELVQYDEAAGNCLDAIAGNGNWGEKSPAFAWSNQGKVLTRLGQFTDAIAAYDKAIAIDPNDAITWTGQGEVLEKLRRYEEALTSYTRAVQIKADYSLALVGQCTMMNKTKQYEPAFAACEQAIQGDGTWRENGVAEAWTQRAIALTGQGKYEDAMASANRAVGINPDYVEAWNYKGAIAWYLQDYPGALVAIQKAIDLNPTYAQAWVNRATVLRTMGLYDSALTSYDQAIRIDPQNSEMWANRSVTLWSLERYEEAIVAADRSIRLNPDSIQAWYNRGSALYALQEYGAALTSYQRVVELDPKNVNALTGQGITLAHLQRYDDAKATLEASLALNSAQPLAQSALELVIKKQQELLVQQQQQLLEQQQRQQEEIMQQIFQPQPQP
ncbi:MAG: tetratricopeptide repeat protein [Oculatellaceae cyanobacterium Prado106]|nr:tetratricopeptide repeat protein [Oculatellaceae cyanobacterium Prado106]